MGPGRTSRQAEEGAGRDCIGHLGQQGPEDQAAQEPLPGGDQGGGEESEEREEGPVEMTSAPGNFISQLSSRFNVYSADVTSSHHCTVSRVGRFFIPGDSFRLTGLHSDIAMMFVEVALRE